MFFFSILHQLIPISKSNHYKWNQRLQITSPKADHSQPWEHNAATPSQHVDCGTSRPLNTRVIRDWLFLIWHKLGTCYSGCYK